MSVENEQVENRPTRINNAFHVFCQTIATSAYPFLSDMIITDCTYAASAAAPVASCCVKYG